MYIYLYVLHWLFPIGEVDLALLSVDDEESLEGIQPLELATADALPLVFDKAQI